MSAKDPLYPVWWTMRRRCERPNAREALRYRDRGITVCERWQSFENFKADVSPRPAGMQLDRKDNNGPYAPDNFRWATPVENANNTRQNRPVTMFGVTKNLNQWSRDLGINQTTFRKILKRSSAAEAGVRQFLERRNLGGTGSGSPPAEASESGNVAAQFEKGQWGSPN